jgi:hypothetical protein
MTKMSDFLVYFLSTAIGVVFWELIKQIGVRLVKGYVPPVVANGLIVLDQILPSLISEGVTSDQMEKRLRQELGSLTGSEWRQIRTYFDPAAFLDAQLHERI